MEWKIQNSNELLDCITASWGKRVYIAGAGKFGKLMGKFLNQKGVQWKGYVDKKMNISPIEGKEVFPYSNKYEPDEFFIVSSYISGEAIVNELKRIGISDNNIIVLPYIRDIIHDISECLVDISKYTKKIEKFRHQYLGQRCFIIGNGPSLKISDLDRLKSENTFACNSIYASYSSTAWRPTFYCAYDHIFCRKMMSRKKDIEKLLSGCKAAFTSVLCEGFEYRDCQDMQNLYYAKIIHKYDDKTGLPLFSEDCSKQIYSAATVAYMMMQLAVYMGFQEIYLLGIDASYSVERHKDGTIDLYQVENHSKILEEEENKFKKDTIETFGYEILSDVDLHLDGYMAARNFADEHGIKIYNAARGGKLEVFERVDFDSIF